MSRTKESFVSPKVRTSSKQVRDAGFSDEAKLDKGAMWPTSFALKELTTEEAKILALIKKAAS